MSFKLMHFETIRHNAGVGFDRNYGIILKWEGWNEVLIQIDFIDPTEKDTVTGAERNHYLSYNNQLDGEVIKGSDTKFSIGKGVKTNDLYFQTFINDFDKTPDAQYNAQYTKTYVIRFINAADSKEFVEYKIIKYANRDTAPSNQGDIMVPPKP